MKEFFKWLNGNKTNIAAFYWGFITPALPIWYGSFELIPGDIIKIYAIIGMFLTYIGLGHKEYKAYKKKLNK